MTALSTKPRGWVASRCGAVQQQEVRMFGRKSGVATVAADAADSLSGYVDPLTKDEKLRRRLAAALAAGLAARQQARRQAGLTGVATRLGSDPVLRAQLVEVASQLQGAQKRMKKARRHRVRNAFLFMTGVGLIVAAVPSLRSAVSARLRGRRDEWAPGGWSESGGAAPATIDEQIEVDVPVTTAYNQWTQFEEFPKFMEGVEEVKQLDDTLLRWAATVAGKRAEWDAKIVEQEPDRRIAWESVDGKHTRGTVTFEAAGPGRTRIRLNMTYTPEGVAEKVGSTAGLDRRRGRGDLERFRELIERQQVESGAWRGEIKDGDTTVGDTTTS